MTTNFKIEPLSTVLAFLWLLTLTGAFFGGRAAKPSEITHNETNVIYQFQVQSQVQAQNQLTIIESTNVETIVFDYAFSNVIWALTNEASHE